MTATYSDLEIETLMANVESDLVERKAAFEGDAPRAVRQAICAFANDLPHRRRPGVVFPYDVSPATFGRPGLLDLPQPEPGRRHARQRPRAALRCRHSARATGVARQ